jgi:hypothetical protein
MNSTLEFLASKTDALRVKYLAAVQFEQIALAERLNQITKDAHDTETVAGGVVGVPAFTAKPQKRRGRPLGAKTAGNVTDIAKSRALQGKYIATVRQFQPAERVEWSAMAKQIGRKKTIAAMKQALEVRKAVAAQQG